MDEIERNEQRQAYQEGVVYIKKNFYGGGGFNGNMGGGFGATGSFEVAHEEAVFQRGPAGAACVFAGQGVYLRIYDIITLQ